MSIVFDQDSYSVYLFGGRSHGLPIVVSSDLWRFSFATSEWICLGDGTTEVGAPPVCATAPSTLPPTPAPPAALAGDSSKSTPGSATTRNPENANRQLDSNEIPNDGIGDAVGSASGYYDYDYNYMYDGFGADAVLAVADAASEWADGAGVGLTDDGAGGGLTDDTNGYAGDGGGSDGDDDSNEVEGTDLASRPAPLPGQIGKGLWPPPRFLYTASFWAGGGADGASGTSMAGNFMQVLHRGSGMLVYGGETLLAPKVKTPGRGGSKSTRPMKIKRILHGKQAGGRSTGSGTQPTGDDLASTDKVRDLRAGQPQDLQDHQVHYTLYIHSLYIHSLLQDHQVHYTYTTPPYTYTILTKTTRCLAISGCSLRKTAHGRRCRCRPHHLGASQLFSSPSPPLRLRWLLASGAHGGGAKRTL
jgi:hypothetical protein